MKREIKFRAWDGVKMLNVISFMPGELIVTVFKESYLYTQTISVLDIMQYTGLKDKNGVEIYEGDVVNWDFDNTVDKGIIIYDNDVAAFLFKINNDKKPDRLNIQQYNYLKSQWINPYEVIGNIHQNPELL